MAKSLLAHLYTHIKGSQEDIATLSLQYILSQSNSLNKSFTKSVVDVLRINIDDTLQYQTQVTGDNDERPDMAGVDAKGKEVLLCEMKFYASLTKNQPLGYIERLKANNGKGLLFICPKSRLLTLWFELKKLCIDDGRDIEEISDLCIKVDGISMAVMTWSEIINNLMNSAESFAEHLIADIKQLKGYCEQIDSEAFIPFKSEELTAVNAKKAERFYLIIDKVSDLILTDKNIRYVKNSSKAGNRNGYISYMFINDFAVSFLYDRAFWADDNAIDTPFWLSIKKVVEGEKWWKQTDDITKQLNRYPDNIKLKWNSATYLGLRVPVHATEDEVCKDMKNQILNYIYDIEDGIKNDNKQTIGG